MPSKKKKYNARFPAGRIKKIMQTDEEVGKVAQAVPVIISRTLELFMESLLIKSMQITLARNARTLTPSHMKQCILSESRFDFLKDLVKNIPDASVQEDNENNAIFEENASRGSDIEKSGISKETSEEPGVKEEISSEGISSSLSPTQISANYYNEQSTSSRTPVIQYGPEIAQAKSTKLSFSMNNLLKDKEEPKIHIKIESEQLTSPHLVSTGSKSPSNLALSENVPALIPLSNPYNNSNAGDNLYIDEDYDN